MRFACLVSVTLALAGTAHAETAPKSPGKARALSIAVPLASMAVGAVAISASSDASAVGGAALVVTGTLVGPSVGLWYAGHPGGKGILLRATSLVLATGAFVIGSDMRPGDCRPMDMTPDECEDQERRYRNDELKVTALFLAGAATYVASAVYDIHAAGKVARRWNEDHGLTFAPTVIPAAGGSKAPGAVLSMRF